eukprot:2763595-Prymnesium_polylepis.1
MILRVVWRRGQVTRCWQQPGAAASQSAAGLSGVCAAHSDGAVTRCDARARGAAGAPTAGSGRGPPKGRAMPRGR